MSEPEPLVHPYTGEVLDPDNVPDEARIALLEVSFDHLRNAVTKLVDAADGKAGNPSRWSWQHVRADDRAQLWAELRSFVDWLLDRYQPTGELRIPPCWYRHPVAVEELTALMAAWRGAYCTGNRPSERMVSWHQNCLWPTLERLGRRARWSQCGARHKDASGVVAILTDEGFPGADAGPGYGDPARAVPARAITRKAS